MIEINNLTTGLVEEKFLKKVAERILKGEKQGKKDLSIALVGQGRIRELNEKYRGKNRVTDVLSFSYSGFHPIYRPQRYSEPRLDISLRRYDNLGEIVICLREVKKNAKRFKSTFKKELARVLIHGILHLLGENHEKSRKEAELMEKKEEYYLSKLPN